MKFQIDNRVAAERDVNKFSYGEALVISNALNKYKESLIRKLC